MDTAELKCGSSGALQIYSPSVLVPAGARPFYGRVESLRALGALAIAGYHFSGLALHGVLLSPNDPWAGTGGWQEALRRLGQVLLPAHAALMLFFVVSGFVLRLSLEYGPQQMPFAASKFLLGRLFRLYPVIIFGVVLTALLGTGNTQAVEQAGRPLTPSLLVANMLLLDVSMNGVYWALQVEMLMVPVILVLYLLERRTGAHVLLGIALCSTALAFGGDLGIWRPLAINVFPFILGMLIPSLGRRFTLGLPRRAATCCALGAIATLLLTRPCLGLYSRLSAVLEGYAAVVFVSLIVYRQDISIFKCLDMKALRLLGLASGSYYVLHMLTAGAGITLASALIPATWSVAVPALVVFLVLPPWLIAIAPLAWCSYYLIEAPGIAVGRRVEQRVRAFMSNLSEAFSVPVQGVVNADGLGNSAPVRPGTSSRRRAG